MKSNPLNCKKLNDMNYAKILIIFCFFLFSQAIKGQELFPISSFAPEVYHGETQNWNICQSDKGVIYIANNKGLLEFNGSVWKLYPSPNRTIMRSVYAKGNRIYSGCYMNFGYWEKDSNLNMRYTSLSDRIKNKLRDDEQFWNIICYEQWVLFQSLHRIYIYDTSRKKFNIIDTKWIVPKIFEVHNQLYFQKIGKGIFQVENGTPLLISDNQIFKTNVIINIFPFGNRLLIETQEKGFFVYDRGSVSQWETSGTSVINSLSVYSSLQLRDGSFVLGTIGEGVFFLSSDGKITKHIDKKSGLQNNTVLSMFEDADQNIWLGLDNGINVLNYASPIRIFFDKNGIFGCVYASAYYKGCLYLGTNQGLYYRAGDENNNFKFVEGTKGQVWMLKVIDNALFCGHNSGTFIVEGDKANLICNKPGTWDIKPVENNHNLLLQGNYEGLNILEKKDGRWHYRNKIEGFNISSRYFEQMPGNQIFVNHEYKGIYKLGITADYRRVAKCEKVANIPLCSNSGIAKYNGELIYCIDSGFYKYNNQAQRFIKDMKMTNAIFGDDSYSSGKMIQGENHTLCVFTKDNVSVISSGKINSEPSVTRIAIPLSIRGGMLGFENMLYLGDDVYLLGTTNGYILFNLYKAKGRKYEIYIGSIEKNKFKNKQCYVPVAITNNQFKSWENDIKFNFYVPVYDKFPFVKYQYKVEGIYDDWSNWTDDSNVVLNNLPSGTYKFIVRAKIGNVLTSNIASYEFSIDKPWYATVWMKLVYGLLILSILLVINFWYKNKYEKRTKKISQEKLVMQLKKEQEIMQLKQDNLNSEVESINRDLASTTMAVVKRDELLNTIKLNLQQSTDNARINSVLKIIDENLDKNSGWSSFQDAFDNMDRNFLKKLKELHPSLTHNDLKLCVYLRLNLSSKEIAPMLNISPQSVEIRRFRLRKKMDLSHEKNLTDYIMNI